MSAVWATLPDVPPFAVFAPQGPLTPFLLQVAPGALLYAYVESQLVPPLELHFLVFASPA